MGEFDCIVIGSGPGGYVTAIRAAQLGMRTAVVERDRLGGRCLNYACIPAKLGLRTADAVSEARGAAEFGGHAGEPTADFAAVGARRRKGVQGLTGGVGGLLKKNGVTVINGEGRLTGDGRVAVNGDEHSASSAIVLATGSTPRSLPGVEFGGRGIGTEEARGPHPPPRAPARLRAGASRAGGP